ncbi:MAG: HEAT repeat domain-containing protein, partial [Candidatus Muiribacteriaceae bacterium]
MSEINELIFKIESSDPDIWREAIDRLKDLDDKNKKRILMQIVTSSSDLGKKYYAKKIFNEIEKGDKSEKKENKSPDNQKSTGSGDKILDYLRSDDYEIVVKAIMHVAKNRLSQYLPELVKMLSPDSHPFVRATLVKAVAFMGKEKHVRDLFPFLDDPDNRVRANTVEALELTGSNEIYAEIMKK